jgi:cysteine-rich repeat protein
MSVRLCVAALALAFAAPVLAVDHPVEGDLLLLREPARAAARRRVRFRANRERAIDPTLVGDPRMQGAFFELAGRAPGDGATGVLPLQPSLWSAIGGPSARKGYRYFDPTRSTGVRKAVFRATGRGGMLSVSGGGRSWPFEIRQPQGAIDLRFTVGGDVWCAQFASFSKNQPGRISARDAPPPPDCAAPPSTTTTTIRATCGNAIAEPPEECDDGNTTAGDGCATGCQLESANPALCAGVPTVAGTDLATVRIASGLTQPVHVAAPRLEPNRVFIVERPGRIRVVENGALLPTPFLAIEDLVRDAGQEEGLLSVAFHPDYESNRRFFVYYVNNAGDLVIARYQVSADADDADEGSAHIVVTIPHPGANNHNGGNLVFGPDGFLYAGTGDGGGGGNPIDNSQNETSRLGKLLRIDADTDTVTIWAKGLRNPWRFSFDRANGDLYIGDVGQNAWEEIDYRPAPNTMGANYGWDVLEGRHCFEPPPLFSNCAAVPGNFAIAPVLEYCNSAFSAPACGSFQPEKGQSIVGGFVYRGCALPDLRGEYFYADTYRHFIRTFKGVSGGNARNLVNRTADLDPPGSQSIGSVTSFGEDARGELYVTDYADGEVYKIVPGN